jgi:hypothetical protein
MAEEVYTGIRAGITLFVKAGPEYHSGPASFMGLSEFRTALSGEKYFVPFRKPLVAADRLNTVDSTQAICATHERTTGYSHSYLIRRLS